MKGLGLIVGVGKRHRGDDQIGLVALNAIAIRQKTNPLWIPPWDLCAIEEDLLSLIDVLPVYERVVIVDGVQAPGALTDDKDFFLWRVDGQPLPMDIFLPSTHGLGLDHALELSRELGVLPTFCLVVGLPVVAAGFSDGISTHALKAIDVFLSSLPQILRDAA